MNTLRFTLLLTVAFFLIGCSAEDDPAPTPFTEKIEVNRIGSVGNSFILLDSTAVLHVDAGSSPEYSISVGKEQVVNGELGFYVYDHITWSILESPDAIPDGVTLTIDPQVMPDSVYSSRMIVATSPTNTGKFTVTLQANRSDFASPKKIQIQVTFK